jgi:hypothetical protein
VSFRLTDVGTGGSLRATLYAAANNGDITYEYNPTSGGSVFFLAGLRAGATFRLEVSKFGQVERPTPYNLLAAFTGVNDTFEPNDDRANAKTITAGTAVQGYLFAGFETTDDPDGTTAWDDWYKVTLGAGAGRFELTNLPIDIKGRVELYNALGESLGYQYSTTEGSSVIMEEAGLAAGDYTIKVNAFSPPRPHVTGSTAPNYMTHPYTLKASVQ